MNPFATATYRYDPKYANRLGILIAIPNVLFVSVRMEQTNYNYTAVNTRIRSRKNSKV